MVDGRCAKCGEVFTYDVESGLNMQRFEPQADNRSIFIGGVVPCCPKCGERYQPPRIECALKIKKVALPVDRLNEVMFGWAKMLPLPLDHAPGACYAPYCPIHGEQ